MYVKINLSNSFLFRNANNDRKRRFLECLQMNNSEDEKIKNNIGENLNKYVSNSGDNNSYLNSDSEYDSEDVKEQVDFLMSQFIKPYEDDAFKCLAIYYAIEDGELLSIKDAKRWIKFSNKYGCGADEELLLTLIKYTQLINEEDRHKEFQKIVELSGIIF